MRYVGGKTRIAKWVAEHALLYANGECNSYLEPFVGSGAVTALLAPHFKKVCLGDAHEDLILMWQAIASGWVPPAEIDKELYYQLKQAQPSALRGLVGYGASFGGKWFGGYTHTPWDAYHQRHTKPHYGAAKASILKLAPLLREASILCKDFATHRPSKRTLVYCDPPYAGTLGYQAVGAFDSSRFWAVAEKWAEQGAKVIVSESSAPKGWRTYAQRERKAFLRVVKQSEGEESETRTEKLFVWGGR